jgi:ribonuclease P protein component
MLLKKNRADKKDIEKIFKEGRFFSSPNLTFKFIFSKNQKIPRISFIAPKNIVKLAVKRNSLRRKGYSILKKHLEKVPSLVLGVFIFKKYQEDMLILENEIKNLLNKIN